MKLPKINLRGLSRSVRYADKKYPEHEELVKERRLIGGEYLGDRRYYMRPHEYLSLVRGLDDEAEKVFIRKNDKYARQNVERLKRAMVKENNFEPLFLHYNPSKNVIIGHEGRHRAIAAAEVGIKHVPVDVRALWDEPYGAFDKTKVRREGSDINSIKFVRSMNTDEKRIEDEAEMIAQDQPPRYGKHEGLTLANCSGDLCYEYVQRKKQPGDKILMQGISTDEASSQGHFAIKRGNMVLEYMPDEGEREFDEGEYKQRMGDEEIIGADKLFKEIPEREFEERVISSRRKPQASSREYAGSEEEQEEELKSLYGD